VEIVYFQTSNNVCKLIVLLNFENFIFIRENELRSMIKDDYPIRITLPEK
jgi:hypothetical protein